jgi:hypothetical protein
LRCESGKLRACKPAKSYGVQLKGERYARENESGRLRFVDSQFRESGAGAPGNIGANE